MAQFISNSKQTRILRSNPLSLFVVIIGLVGFISMGCNYVTGLRSAGQPAIAVAQTDVERKMNPSVSVTDLSRVVTGEQTFAVDLYHRLQQNQKDNFVYSPYSISLGIALVYAGARNNTETQIANVLHYPLSQENLHPAFNTLDLELQTYSENKEGPDAETGVQLNVVNSIWGQTNYSFSSNYLDTIAKNYGAELKLVNFKETPEIARTAINEWINNQTNGKITNMIPNGLVRPETNLILANALYLKAAWKRPFRTTTNGTFYLLNGEQPTIPMMSTTAAFGYAKGDIYEAVELTYEGEDLSMVVFLPATGQFEVFEKSLNTEKLDEILGSLESKSIALTMPKFEYTSNFKLAETLAEMGMPQAFSAEADFSGIDGTMSLSIDDVLHETFITVDETGTEAAAATAAIMSAVSAAVPDVELTVDRPFIFVIRDTNSGVLLFIGRVVNPAN